MDAVKFIEERNRMCRSFNGCGECPAFEFADNKIFCAVGRESTIGAAAQITIVEEWSAAHPRKTRQDVFLKHYPDAPRDNDNLLTACPKCVDANVSCDIDKNATVKKLKRCDGCRREFWMQEVE